MSMQPHESSSTPSVSLEDILESDIEFSAESAGRTMGRASWLAVRSRAEFLLFVSNLDVTTAQRVGLMAVFDEATNDWMDFVNQGVGPGAVRHTGDMHPRERELDSLIESTVEVWDEQTMEEYDITGAEYEASGFSTGLGSMEGVEIIRMVRELGQKALEP